MRSCQAMYGLLRQLQTAFICFILLCSWFPAPPLFAQAWLAVRRDGYVLRGNFVNEGAMEIYEQLFLHEDLLTNKSIDIMSGNITLHGGPLVWKQGTLVDDVPAGLLGGGPSSQYLLDPVSAPSCVDGDCSAQLPDGGGMLLSSSSDASVLPDAFLQGQLSVQQGATVSGPLQLGKDPSKDEMKIGAILQSDLLIGDGSGATGAGSLPSSARISSSQSSDTDAFIMLPDSSGVTATLGDAIVAQQITSTGQLEALAGARFAGEVTIGDGLSEVGDTLSVHASINTPLRLQGDQSSVTMVANKVTGASLGQDETVVSTRSGEDGAIFLPSAGNVLSNAEAPVLPGQTVYGDQQLAGSLDVSGSVNMQGDQVLVGGVLSSPSGALKLASNGGTASPLLLDVPHSSSLDEGPVLPDGGGEMLRSGELPTALVWDSSAAVLQSTESVQISAPKVSLGAADPGQAGSFAWSSDVLAEQNTREGSFFVHARGGIDLDTGSGQGPLMVVSGDVVLSRPSTNAMHVGHPLLNSSGMLQKLVTDNATQASVWNASDQAPQHVGPSATALNSVLQAGGVQPTTSTDSSSTVSDTDVSGALWAMVRELAIKLEHAESRIEALESKRSACTCN